jgi:predicted nucleic acid-binding protein
VIVYLDTSSLVKLYVPERESVVMKRLVETAEVVATSHLAYVEARAAFARKHRERGLTRKDYRTVIQDFDHDGRVILLSQTFCEIHDNFLGSCSPNKSSSMFIFPP